MRALPDSARLVLARSCLPELFELLESGPRCVVVLVPDANVGGEIATISEVSDDEKTMFRYS